MKRQIKTENEFRMESIELHEILSKPEALDARLKKIEEVLRLSENRLALAAEAIKRVEASLNNQRISARKGRILGQPLKKREEEGHH